MNKHTYVAWLVQRITFCKGRLNSIERAFAEEFAKPIQQRQRILLLFLDRERSVYSFALAELEEALVRLDHD